MRRDHNARRDHLGTPRYRGREAHSIAAWMNARRSKEAQLWHRERAAEWLDNRRDAGASEPGLSASRSGVGRSVVFFEISAIQCHPVPYVQTVEKTRKAESG